MQLTKTEKKPEILQSEIRSIGENMLLVSNLLKTDDGTDTGYSILVTLVKQGEFRDASLAVDVSRCQSIAEEMFQKIVEGTVTPCTLTDVLEDLL